MTPGELKDRTQAFAVAVIRFAEGLPRSRSADGIGRQLLRAGTSVAVNYRSACRARSRKDFIAKMAIVEEEADEAGFWLDLVAECGYGDGARGARLRKGDRKSVV